MSNLMSPVKKLNHGRTTVDPSDAKTMLDIEFKGRNRVDWGCQHQPRTNLLHLSRLGDAACSF